jgi:hypothetical protein
VASTTNHVSGLLTQLAGRINDFLASHSSFLALSQLSRIGNEKRPALRPAVPLSVLRVGLVAVRAICRVDVAVAVPVAALAGRGGRAEQGASGTADESTGRDAPAA